MVSLAIKCQEQHHLQGWCKGWRDQVRNAPRLFSRASHVSGGLLPPLTWALGLPRRVGAGEGRGEGSVLKAILLGHGASGLWGISLWKSPTGHSPHPEILDSQDRHKSLLGAVCCFKLVWGLSSCPALRSLTLQECGFPWPHPHPLAPRASLLPLRPWLEGGSEC